MPRPIPEQLATLVARRFRVIGDPTRIRLLDQLRQSEASVSHLAGALETTQQNVSKHLNMLLEAGIVGRRKEGNHAYYSISDPSVLDLCEQVCGSVQRQLTELERILDGSR